MKPSDILGNDLDFKLINQSADISLLQKKYLRFVYSINIENIKKGEFL